MKHQAVGWIKARNPTQSNFNTSLILFTLLLVSGCHRLPSQSSPSDVILETTKNCASQPPSELILRNVKDITLKSTLEEMGKGNINSMETVGYKFKGKSGQKLKLELTEGVCIWIIDPNNRMSHQIAKETTLKEKGTYLIQLAVLNGKPIDYSLKMGLDVKTSSPEPISTLNPSPSLRFALSDFPKSSCGDKLPSNIDAYPVNFYPVFVPLSQDNLENLKNNFCQDSFPKIRKDTKVKEIQVSSFSSLEKAKQFVKFLDSESIEAEVGQPTVVESPR